MRTVIYALTFWFAAAIGLAFVWMLAGAVFRILWRLGDKLK
jgi:hypothetical protein